MQNKPTQVNSDRDHSLLELSAREVQTLMKRFGIRSQGCPEELESLDELMLTLELDLKKLVPKPHFVPCLDAPVH